MDYINHARIMRRDRLFHLSSLAEIKLTIDDDNIIIYAQRPASRTGGDGASPITEARLMDETIAFVETFAMFF